MCLAGSVCACEGAFGDSLSVTLASVPSLPLLPPHPSPPHTSHSPPVTEDDSHLPKDKIALLKDIIKSPFFLSVKEVSWPTSHMLPGAPSL